MMQAIKNLISQLYKDTNIRVIQGNQTAPKPPLPYGVYNVTSPYIKGVGREDITYVEDETGFLKVKTEQYRVTLSFNFYAATNGDTIDLASKVRQWFLFMGEDFIEEQNIALYEVSNTENRTTFLVDSYEYKYGFDVHLRLTDEQMRQIQKIENVTFLKEE
jgi:hypothetical protein